MGIFRNMAQPKSEIVFDPEPRKIGLQWRVVVIHSNGQKEHISGFADRAEALEWLASNRLPSLAYGSAYGARLPEMTKPPKRPRDFSQAAKLVIDVASGQVEDREPTPEEQGKDAAAVALGRKGGAAPPRNAPRLPVGPLDHVGKGTRTIRNRNQAGGRRPPG